MNSISISNTAQAPSKIVSYLSRMSDNLKLKMNFIKLKDLEDQQEQDQAFSNLNYGFNFRHDSHIPSSLDPMSRKSLVYYNPTSIDSVFACSLLASLPNTDLTFEPYSQLNNLPDQYLEKFKTVYVVGVEMTEQHLSKLAELTSITLADVVIMGYRDSYEWLSRIPRNARQTFEKNVWIFKPSKYWYGDLLYRTDNTAVQMVIAFLQALAIGNNSSAEKKLSSEERTRVINQIIDQIPLPLYETAILASRLVSMAFPVAPMHITSENWYEVFVQNNTDPNSKNSAIEALRFGSKPSPEQINQWHEQESRNRAQIYNMLPYLRKLLTEPKKAENAKAIPAVKGMLMYSGMESEAKTIVASSLFTDNVSGIAMIPVHEINHFMIMSIIAKGRDTAITYEDRRNGRIWRIYASNAERAESIAKRFDYKLSWSEGSVFCIVTELPVVRLKH